MAIMRYPLWSIGTVLSDQFIFNHVAATSFPNSSDAPMIIIATALALKSATRPVTENHPAIAEINAPVNITNMPVQNFAVYFAISYLYETRCFKAIFNGIVVDKTPNCADKSTILCDIFWIPDSRI